MALAVSVVNVVKYSPRLNCVNPINISTTAVGALVDILGFTAANKLGIRAKVRSDPRIDRT